MGAFFGSLVFHAALFAIMATTSVFLPPASDSEQLELFWLYPSFLLGGEAVSPVQPKAFASQEIPDETARIRSAKLSSEKKEMPAEAVEAASPPTMHAPAERTSLPPVAENVVAKSVVTLPAEEEPQSAEEPEMTIPARVEPAKPPEVKKAPPEPLPIKETAQMSETKPKVAPAKVVPVQPQPAPPPKETAPVQNTVAAPAKKEAEKPSPVARRQTSSEVAVKKPPTDVLRPEQDQRKEVVAQQSVAQKTAEKLPAVPIPVQSVSKQVRLAKAGGDKAGEQTVVPVQKAVQAAPAIKPVPAKGEGEKPRKIAKAKGLFMPPLFGDLKLEVVAKDEVLQRMKVSVLFREFRESRRNRPFTKAEAMREQTLAPKIVRTGEKTLQAIIETTGEGVYDFRLEGEPERSIEASFLVKVFEKSAKAMTRHLGTRVIANKASIEKILMPEGILWDDPVAFSGSLEDSDSVTRFNTDTGLVWKEYN